MFVKNIVVGSYEVNCFIVGCEKHRKAVIIDPGDDAEKIFRCINDNDISVVYIINTHGHGDHIGAVFDLKKRIDAPLYDS